MLFLRILGFDTMMEEMDVCITHGNVRICEREGWGERGRELSGCSYIRRKISSELVRLVVVD